MDYFSKKLIDVGAGHAREQLFSGMTRSCKSPEK